MPLYDYECASCNKREEHFHSYQESIEVLCSSCSSPMAKCLSAPKIRKGAGIYSLDIAGKQDNLGEYKG